jgi:sarcosine oxidase/L-pipecolate oxidase
MERVARYLSTLGPHIQFVNGQRGNVTQLVREDPGGQVAGALTADGTWHRGDIVILAAGAWSSQLLDFEGQATPAMGVATHINLSPMEASSLRGMSVFDVWSAGRGADKSAGYLVPPNQKRQLKIVGKL